MSTNQFEIDINQIKCYISSFPTLCHIRENITVYVYTDLYFEELYDGGAREESCKSFSTKMK